MVIATLSLAHRRREGILVCLLVAVLLAGCGLGGSQATVATGLITATPTIAAAATPTPVAPTTTRATTPTPPSVTTVATPTMMPGHTSAMPSAAPAPTPTIAASPPQASAAPGVVEVRIIDFAFDPPLVEVPVGTTVTWRLVQGYHTVATADFMLNSPPLENVGDTYSFTFTIEGTYDYICGIHPEMLGQVRVVP
jgi:plastocyanin